MRRKSLVLLVLLAIGSAALLLLASGCGSSSTGQAPTQTAPAQQGMTKREFVRRTQAQCHRGYLKQEAAMERYAEKHGFDFASAKLQEREEMDQEVVLDFVRKRIAYWKSLPRPEGDEKEIGKIIKAMEKGLRMSERNPWAMSSSADPEPFTENRHLTGEYGPWLCGQA